MSEPGTLPVLDVEALREQAGGDPELVLELVGLFNSDAPTLLTAIREGLGRRDAHTVERAAHRLKGSLGVLGAHAAHEAARQLEAASRGGDIAGAVTLASALEHEIERLEPALAQAAG